MAFQTQKPLYFNISNRIGACKMSCMLLKMYHLRDRKYWFPRDYGHNFLRDGVPPIRVPQGCCKKREMDWFGLVSILRLINYIFNVASAMNPLVITPPPDYPSHKAVWDFCDIEGHNFLTYADQVSRWVEMEPLASRNTSRNVQKTFLWWFAMVGVPKEISTDGGLQFNSQ